ncbi:MAG: hypothetical protein AAGD38_05275 [Acidobacteriota bacterium]
MTMQRRATAATDRPHVVMVIPRGEAVRNFLYSHTLDTLSEQARVTLLSVVDDQAFRDRYGPQVDAIHSLDEHPQDGLTARLRILAENAHDRWLWGKTAQNHWVLRDRRARARGAWAMWQRRAVKVGATLLGNRPAVHMLTRAERRLAHRRRPTRDFDRLFTELEPDLVFNGSHIHGLAGELPLRVAKAMGIPTAGFIFSWDNLTSRSRIFVPYDHYLVWHHGMKRLLLSQYDDVSAERVHITGTPQFDFHFDSRYLLSRDELCGRLGLDPSRPFVLYTAGIAHHFFEEHRHAHTVLRLLGLDPEHPDDGLDLPTRPQLVVRTNIKDTSPEMKALAARGLTDVHFPVPGWEPRWQTPLPEDLAVYTSMLHHCALGINAASTVSLELMAFDRPVINLDYDPPGSDIPPELGYKRHITFDHYGPVAASGAVMVARSDADMADMLFRGLTDPDEQSAARTRYLRDTFGDTLDGQSGTRVAQCLLALARGEAPR